MPTENSQPQIEVGNAKVTKRTHQFLRHPYLIEHEGFALAQMTGPLTLVSVGLEAGKPLRRKVKTRSGNAERTSAALVIIPMLLILKMVSAVGIEPTTY